MEESLLQEGAELVLAGMGTVFVFLTSLVFATSLMSWLVQRLAPAGAASGDVSEEEVAAISAAIIRHRRNQ